MKKVAQKLRRDMTDAERLLWSKLRRKQLAGVCFYRQRVIGPYIVDFYCPAAVLVIELDGGQHFQDEGREKDALRDTYLKDHGFRVLRFDDHQALKETKAVLEKIFHVVSKG
jgi:very-short-patch-repair endonuclease